MKLKQNSFKQLWSVVYAVTNYFTVGSCKCSARA